MIDTTTPARSTADGVLLQSIRQAMARAHQVTGASVRSQHPKTHGVVHATFVIHELPAAYRVGLFAVPGPVAAWIRFSNGREIDDRIRDVRGMAIKLLDVADATVAPDSDNASTQDVVLADHPAFFARDAAHFLQFLALKGKQGAELKHASETGTTDRTAALKEEHQAQLLAEFPLLAEFFTIARSPLTRRYFSQTPYRFGDAAVKYFVTPDATSDSDPLPASADALRDSMVRVLTRERTPVRFAFGIEVQTHPETMPIDDATVRWNSSEKVVLATVVIPPQQFVSEERRVFGEGLSFSPWHARPAHAPLGSINQARRDAYTDSSTTRHVATRMDRQAPTGSHFNALTLSRFFDCFSRGDIKACNCACILTSSFATSASICAAARSQRCGT